MGRNYKEANRKMKTIIRQDWFMGLVDDIEEILHKGISGSRQMLLETYHAAGRRIIEEEQRAPIEYIIQSVARAIEKSRRTVWYAVQFARKYKSVAELIDSVSEDEKVSWSKVCRFYLPESKFSKHICESWAQKCRVCNRIKP